MEYFPTVPYLEMLKRKKEKKTAQLIKFCSGNQGSFRKFSACKMFDYMTNFSLPNTFWIKLNCYKCNVLFGWQMPTQSLFQCAPYSVEIYVNVRKIPEHWVSTFVPRLSLKPLRALTQESPKIKQTNKQENLRVPQSTAVWGCTGHRGCTMARNPQLHIYFWFKEHFYQM